MFLPQYCKAFAMINLVYWKSSSFHLNVGYAENWEFSHLEENCKIYGSKIFLTMILIVKSMNLYQRFT